MPTESTDHLIVSMDDLICYKVVYSHFSCLRALAFEHFDPDPSMKKFYFMSVYVNTHTYTSEASVKK